MSMFGFELPKDFLIGTAHSAFQSEGAWDRDGKSESIMEYYAKKYAGGYSPNPNIVPTPHTKPYSLEMPDKGCFFYDHYEEYIDDMQKTGQNTFRMSLAWPRIIPTGVGAVNPKGIAYYNRVIDKLLSCGITPFVDIYHWDMPQCLMEQGGFLNPAFPDWFEAYARVCFEAFGDRVKLWSTFNESEVSIADGYHGQIFPPFYPGTVKERHAAAHNCLIAHFRAVRLYRSMKLGGKIGAVNCTTAVSPAHMTVEDVGSVERQVERYFGWWTQPMLEGTYPQSLLRQCPDYFRGTMPEHYQEDLDKWFDPMDFIGINYYVARRTEYDPNLGLKSRRVQNFYAAPGQAFAPYPAGLYDVIQYVARRYHNVEMYVTENGCALPNIHDEEKECDDPERIRYLREHLRMVVRLIRAGYNLKGYYYWNDADCYEELRGNDLRFGLTWVDHETGKRRWKKSRYYFSEICKSHMVD